MTGEMVQRGSEGVVPAHPPTQRGSARAARRTSVWVYIVGAISVVMAVVGLVFSAFTASTPLMGRIMATAVSFSPSPEANVPVDVFRRFGFHFAMHGVAMILVAVLLMVGAVGLVQVRAWSRFVLLAWAIVKIAGSVWSVTLGTLLTLAQAEAMRATVSSQAASTINSSLSFNLSVQGINLLFMIAWPVFIFVWMNRKAVREEVEGWRR